MNFIGTEPESSTTLGVFSVSCQMALVHFRGRTLEDLVECVRSAWINISLHPGDLLLLCLFFCVSLRHDIAGLDYRKG